VSITNILKFSEDEELIANSLKIIRYSIKDEANHQRTILDYPDLINDVI
jgi:hypothetical protein